MKKIAYNKITENLPDGVYLGTIEDGINHDNVLITIRLGNIKSILFSDTSKLYAPSSDVTDNVFMVK